MADNILRLRVQSDEYDAKLKKAAEGIRHLAEVAHRGGGELTGLEKAELDYVKGLGSMETKSRTAAGSVRELESTYKELKVIYDQLNDVEKQDEGGRALRASLDQIKQRAKEARAQLDTASKSLNDNGQSAQQSGGILESLAGKFTLNIDALKLFDMGLSVTKTALNVAKDAFFATEGNIDEWGRTVKGAEGAYDVFLQTLNNGNWSNFFSNLHNAIQGARDLYDSLDRLGSIKSNNQAAIAIQQQQVQQLRLMKQQGKNVDDQLKAATQRLAQLQQQAVNAGKQAGSQMIGNTIRNGYNSQEGAGKITGASVDAAVQDIVTHGQAAFDRYAKTVNQFESDRRNYKSITRSDMDGNRFTEQVFDIRKLTKEQQKQYNLAKTITDRETEIQKGITLYAQAVNEGTAAAREEFKGNRYALQGSGGKGGNGGKTKQQQAEDKVAAALQDYQQTIDKASLELKSGAATEADVKKKQLSAQERLYDAYGDAYALYKDPKYKDAQDKAAEEIVKLGGEVKAATEAQEAARKAARELESAQKKLADAQNKLSDAQATGDLRQIYAAEKGVKTAEADVQRAQQGVDALAAQTVEVYPKWATAALDALPQELKAKMGEVKTEIPLTIANLDAFISKTKEDIANAPLGTEMYNNLTEKLKDATTMRTLLQELMERGLKGEDLERVSKSLQEKLLSPEGIDQKAIKQWLETVSDKIEEQGGIGMSLNSETGEVTDKKSGADEWKQFDSKANQFIGGLSSVSSGLKGLGVELPKEVDQVIGVMQSVMQIIQGVESIISVFQVSAITANTAALIANTTALAVNTAVPSIFAHGGVVPAFAHGGLIGRAALGMIIPGNSYSGDNLRLPVDGSRGVIGVNSGELILNKSSQNNLASSLLRAEDLVSTINDGGITLSSDQQAMLSSVADGGTAGTPSSQQYVTGDAIVLGVNNYLNSTGQGEIVTTEYLRNKGLI